MIKQRMRWQVWLVVAIVIMLLYKALSYFDLPLKPHNQNRTNTTISANGYQARQFDPMQDMFQEQPYPKELTDINENDLLGMKCSETFVGDEISSIDPDLLTLAKKASEYIAAEWVDEITFCETQDNKTIVTYEKYAGGGGMESVAYIAVANTENTLEQITSIPNPRLPYFVCRNPLQLTTDNILYHSCIAGDAGFGAMSIYKIDLNQKTNTLLTQCTSQADLENKRGGKGEVTCK